MKVLADSDTSAQVEIDAAFREVNETLTPTQLQAIKAMKLTAQDVSAFEQGMNTTVQSTSKVASSTSGGGFGGPDGGGPGGDGLGGIIAGSSQSSTSNTQSSPVSSEPSSQVPTELINALIKEDTKRTPLQGMLGLSINCLLVGSTIIIYTLVFLNLTIAYFNVTNDTCFWLRNLL